MTRLARQRAIVIAAVMPLLLGGCEVFNLGVMNHAGPVAESQWHLYLVVGAVLLFVAGPVLILTPIVAWHYRISNKHNAFKPDWNFSWPLEILIWIPPIGIVIGLGFLLWIKTHDLDPYNPLASAQPPLEVQAVGFDWKWLFIYPDRRIAVVNELAIPVGRPVRISLTSGTVMQSLLIPRLGSQIYAMGGMRTLLHLEASETGTFRGENTQFNGKGFQKQRFDVVALPPAQFAAWEARVRASARPLDGTALKALFAQSIPSHPIYFSTTPPDLFRRIMAITQRPNP